MVATDRSYAAQRAIAGCAGIGGLMGLMSGMSLNSMVLGGCIGLALGAVIVLIYTKWRG